MQTAVPQSLAAVAWAPTDPATLPETRQTLLVEARRRFGSIPPELLVDHVLRSPGHVDFDVHAAALEALARRWAFAERDGLVLAKPPPGGTVLGSYTTTRRRPAAGDRARHCGRSRRAAAHEPRPYTSLLESLHPLRASCDCPDFLRSSLGLCKHLLVVLDHLYGSRRRVDAARREGVARIATLPRLVWDPVLPGSGPLDRVAGLALEDRVDGARRKGAGGASHDDGAERAPGSDALSSVRRLFPDGGLHAGSLDDAARRHDVLARLHAAIRGAAGDPTRLTATPAARALVAEELERAARRLGNQARARDALAGLRSLRRKPYPYQREGVERFLRTGRLLLADDMGLGKTIQAIAACHALFAAGRVRRGVVIAPPSLKPQWLREWQETTSVPLAAVEGGPTERARAYREHDRGFLIIGYEQLLRDAEHVHRLAPEIVVLDEAQRIKNYATKSAAYVKSLTPEYRLVLTGTPMENRLEELASILDWVDDVALAPKWRLVPWYTAWEGDGSSRGRAGARHLDTLRARLAPCVLRRVRREVLAQLPPRTDTRVPVAMTPQQVEEHDALNLPIKSLIQRSKRRPLTQAEFLRLMQLLTQQRIISNGLGQIRFEEIWPTYARVRPDAALLEGLFTPKLAELRRLVSDLVVDQERKVVVFSQWRRMLRLAAWSVSDLLADAGLRAVFFTGAERPAQRTRNIVDFHDEPDVRVMFLSDAGGVGLNLQRAASACVNLELPWNPAVLEQRVGRIYRLGQRRPIDVYNLVSEGGIESRIAGLLGAKQALFSGLFDGTSAEIRFDTAASFLTRVERLLDPGVLPTPPGAPAREPQATESDDADEPAAAEAALADGAITDELQRPPELVAPQAATGRDDGASDELLGVDPARATRALLDALRIERTSDGRVRIEAPPAAAASLIALFEGMAKLLAASCPTR